MCTRAATGRPRRSKTGTCAPTSSECHPCSKYRRLHSPAHLFINALNLVLNGLSPSPFPALPVSFPTFFFSHTFLGLPPWKEKGLTWVLFSPQVRRVTRAPSLWTWALLEPLPQLPQLRPAGPGHGLRKSPAPNPGRNWPLLGSLFDFFRKMISISFQP